MSTQTLYVDARTGEVTPPEVVEQVARDFHYAEVELALATAEVTKLRAIVEGYRQDLQAIVPAEGAVDIGSHVVVMEPAARPAQRVDRQGAARHREVLLDLGLGRETLDYHAPTAAEVRAEKARLIAAGVPLGDLLPEPIAGPPMPKVVEKP